MVRQFELLAWLMKQTVVFMIGAHRIRFIFFWTIFVVFLLLLLRFVFVLGKCLFNSFHFGIRKHINLTPLYCLDFMCLVFFSSSSSSPSSSFALLWLTLVVMKMHGHWQFGSLTTLFICLLRSRTVSFLSALFFFSLSSLAIRFKVSTHIVCSFFGLNKPEDRMTCARLNKHIVFKCFRFIKEVQCVVFVVFLSLFSFASIRFLRKSKGRQVRNSNKVENLDEAKSRAMECCANLEETTKHRRNEKKSQKRHRKR